jgi:hypothetical protein
MYWPIGAPRIYAASNNAAQSQIHESDDDAESRVTTESSGSVVETTYFEREDGDKEEGPSIPATPITPITPATPGIMPVEHDHEHSSSSIQRQIGPSLTEAGKLPLLSLRASKTGHLFAVITSNSLTVWQTTVGGI